MLPKIAWVRVGHSETRVLKHFQERMPLRPVRAGRSVRNLRLSRSACAHLPVAAECAAADEARQIEAVGDGPPETPPFSCSGGVLVWAEYDRPYDEILHVRRGLRACTHNVPTISTACDLRIERDELDLLVLNVSSRAEMETTEAQLIGCC
jgi:hypothetical protein